MKKEKIAIELGVFKDYSLEDSLRYVKEEGYTNVELASRRIYSHFEVDRADEKEVLRVKDLLEKFNLKSCAVFTYGNHLLASPEERTRKTAVEEMRRVIYNARLLDCDLVASEMKPGRLQMALSEQEEIEQCKTAWKKSMRELISDLDSTNIRLAFEPHPGDFVEDSNSAVDLINEIDCGRIGYLFCFPHTFNFSGELTDMIRYAGERLFHVHIGDSNKVDRIVPPYVVKSSPELSLRFKREVHEHLIPGRGDVDFQKGLRALDDINYNGFISVQPFSHSDNPKEAARSSLEYLLKFVN